MVTGHQAAAGYVRRPTAFGAEYLVWHTGYTSNSVLRGR